MTDSGSCANHNGEIRVEVMYDYSYKSDSDQENISFKKGEEYFLVGKTSENWWYVKKHQEDQKGVYIPAQYVREIKKKKAKTNVSPVSAPVTEVRPSLKPLPNFLHSKSQMDEIPELNKGAIEELDKLRDDLKVPEAFQDTEHKPRETVDHSAGQGDRIETAGRRSPNAAADNPVASEVPEKGPSDRHSKEETRVESETSDYKTDSRESLDSEGRGFEAGEEPSMKAKEEADAAGDQDVVNSRPMVKSESMGDYANLEEIQKAIQSRAAPPLAENLLPPGYSRPYQDQAPRKRVEELVASADVETKVTEKKAKDADPVRFSTLFDTPSSRKRFLFSSKKSLSVGVQLTTTPPDENQSREPRWDAGSDGAASSPPGGGDETSPLDSRTSKITLQPKMVDKQGTLQKAKIDENSKKIKKNWSQSYTVLCQNLLYFYKDMKSSSSTKPRSISSLGKPEFTVDLKGCKVTSAPEDKNIKKDAFMLLTTTKTHFLLFHDDVDNNLHWKQSIQNNISALESGLMPETAGSLSKNKPDLSLSSCDIVESKQTIAERLKKFLLGRPSKESIKKRGIYKEVTFGSSLVAICEREKGNVPRFVTECVLAVEARGLTIDGLYRVSGNVSSVQKLRSMVDLNEYYNLQDATWDIHTITGALKLFFRELSEPLFTFKHFQSFLASLNNLNSLKELIKQLPSAHRQTMKFLFRHFAKVLEHSRDNRMNVQGMAIVFGPTLLWPEKASKDSNLALSLMQQGQLVEFVINNCKNIFG